MKLPKWVSDWIKSDEKNPFFYKIVSHFLKSKKHKIKDNFFEA